MKKNTRESTVSCIKATEHLASWSDFIAKRVNAPPLVFVSGVRYFVKRRVYCEMHSHRVTEVVYHPRGKGVTRLGKGDSIKFDKGDVIVYAPEAMHDQILDQEGEDLVVKIALPDGLRKVPHDSFRVPDIEDRAIIEDIRLLTRGHVYLNPMEQAIFNLRATSILYSLIQLASAQSTTDTQQHPHRYVQQAEQYIRNNFAKIDELPEVALAIGISYHHLRHLFKQQRKMRMIDYLNDVRVERAKNLLVHSMLPIKQVATMCGFKDEYYFSYVFKRIAQMPPGHYRSKTV